MHHRATYAAKFVLAVFLCTIVKPANGLAGEAVPLSHELWSSTALLIESLQQEQTVLSQLSPLPTKQAEVQKNLLSALIAKADYRPKHSVGNDVSAPNKQRTLKLPSEAESWNYLLEKHLLGQPSCKVRNEEALPCQALEVLQKNAGEEQMGKDLQALARRNPKVYQQGSIRYYHALLLLREKNYPEALRILFSLQNTDAKMRLIYNKIQRVFSLQQKASGDVVLRQSF